MHLFGDRSTRQANVIQLSFSEGVSRRDPYGATDNSNSMVIRCSVFGYDARFVKR